MPEKTLKTLPEFIQEHDLKLKVKQMLSRNDRMGRDMPPSSTHWWCSIQYRGKSMKISFSQGPAHKNQPELVDVLSCIVSDASVKHSCRDVEDFMDEFGYKSAKEARPIYEACLKEADRLLLLLGYDLFNELLFETEPY